VHQLTVSYPGDAGHTAASASVSVQVAPAATTTSAKVTTKKVVRKKTAAKVSVTVKASGFTPSGKVTVLLGKKKIGTATLKNGKATVKLKKFAKAGTAKLTVTYAGAPTAKASSKKLKLKVRSR
jgi:5'-nucleotidase